MLQYLNDVDYTFPPVDLAMEDGLLAVGGDLHPLRLLEAYRRGIFPWFNVDEPPLWWSPNPRCVLFPKNIKVTKSMKAVLRNEIFEFKIDTDFEGVMRSCKDAPRPGQLGTWITDDIVKSYTQLHHMGFAHSAETWQNGTLVGGLYGIHIGNVFCGESMFSKSSNASKFAFIKFATQAQNNGIQLIDCQIQNPHLESLGAEMISRDSFLTFLKEDFSL